MPYGICNAMTLKLDKSGRIVVPKPLRDRLGLKPDTELEVIEQPGGMLLRVAPQRPSMVNVDGLWVHQGTVRDDANWDHVLEDAREERLQALQSPQPV